MALTALERQRRRRAKMRDDGRVDVQITVPATLAPLIKDIARICNARDFEAVKRLVRIVRIIQSERRIRPADQKTGKG